MIVGRGEGDPLLIAGTSSETSDFIPDLSKLGVRNLQTRPRSSLVVGTSNDTGVLLKDYT